MLFHCAFHPLRMMNSECEEYWQHQHWNLIAYVECLAGFLIKGSLFTLIFYLFSPSLGEKHNQYTSAIIILNLPFSFLTLSNTFFLSILSSFHRIYYDVRRWG